MSRESALLLFDEERPCWTAELEELAGEDPEELRSLAGAGFLAGDGLEGWILTETGRARFREWARESFLEARPGSSPADPALSRLRLEAALRLDRGFHSPQGAKEYRLGVGFPYRPRLPRPEGPEELDRLEEHPLARAFRADFPREASLPPSSADLADWAKRHGAEEGRLDLDVLFLHRYDYAYYLGGPSPTDPLGLANADRLFCRILRDRGRGEEGGAAATVLRGIWADLADLRGALEFARRALLPGRFDTDAQEQGANTWWVWMPERESAARALAEVLAPFRERLIGPSAPLDFWILSLEALRGDYPRQETFYELFDARALPVARTA